MRVFSFGGGVQSTAALVLASQGKIDFQTFLFCNVGNDSEHPDTLRYVQEIALPYAERHAIRLLELHKTRNGEPDTVYTNLVNSRASIGIPVYMSNGAPAKRSCTVDYKVKLVEGWVSGASYAEIGIGFSLDEFRRMSTAYNTDKKRNVYPLIELRLTRQDCMKVIADAGLPIPPKSSCYFCPFHSMAVWQEMRHSQPDLFQKSVDLERQINEKRERLGKDAVWLSRTLKPLDKATTELQQLSFDDDDFCDTGYCFL